jgi:hypothetical protein
MSYNKYKAIKTEVDGITFDSKKEARRYQDLKLLEKSGAISKLILQPSLRIEVNGVKVCDYRADFSYYDNGTNKRIWEDVKGVKTSIYRLKKKLVFALYGIEILET